MTKNGGKAKWIGIGLTTLGMTAAVIVSFVWAQADIKAVGVKADGIKEIMIHKDADIEKSMVLLKEGGCAPSNKNKFNIALMQKDISTIQKTQTEMRTDQKAGFKEILDRLPK